MEHGIQTNPATFVRIFKALGLTLWSLQMFEDVIARYIVLILKLPPSRLESEVNAIFESLHKQTMGQLFAELRRANKTNSVSEFEQRMNTLLADRNWLVHKSWSTNGGDVHNDFKGELLALKFDAIGVEANALSKFFTELATNWTKSQGVTEEQIQQKTHEILKQRGVIPK